MVAVMLSLISNTPLTMGLGTNFCSSPGKIEDKDDEISLLFLPFSRVVLGLSWASLVSWELEISDASDIWHLIAPLLSFLSL